MAKAILIALAPEMAEIILELVDSHSLTDWCFMPYGEPCEERSCSSCVERATVQELADKLQKIIDEAKQRAIRQAEWKAEQKDKNE